ncbi:MAG: hypothetical protein CO158_00750 [Piscirickettsiaceae bacterium CG_4_9_14_3_um_filter_43_564]|nr:hypothetical protein [Thiomicrospira sp.]PIQ03229.1 MAG: hypothetical protein COW74_08150 [Piscirickettsiaceae bacterium CG18_big_fil_WC_8_21_14_2_50_44_103]PIU39586.1 MAG: hypothetical protein COT01_00650 [Piscirickettsiaceae bacterium CG07_land_8_20_14_0_80_44_28]PIW58590.1 MAG: hypothetical protein COW14_00850 [Piscirickettsiaceae bacterium CG12_big_fil_rev_8_21_14_0_65_44_934]PIW78151.1 MAG: hypothetical protein CO000_03195 [Piscirickettsiaceae bacterium CG_4_8_14_3_um_filter_44_38]PIX7
MSYLLTAEFLTYWHIGTGRGSGQNLDALVEKDAHGLPYVPGKTIKGLFRDAFYKMDHWQSTQYTDFLFGARTAEDKHTRDETTPGRLRFSNLNLIERDYLIQHDNQDDKYEGKLIPHLFQTQASTAIDEKTGSAKEKSLRMIEVVVPANLEGDIEYLPSIHDKEQPVSLDDLTKLLEQAASLITHIGANKNRGMGRVRLEVKA